MDLQQRDWSLELNPFEWKSDPVQLETKVRFSIFTITGVCAGLPALVWSVSEIIHHRKNGHHISIFIILLLLSDFLELFLSPYILIKDLLNELVSITDWTCKFLRALWLSLRVCGFLLNQLVALEGILKYPLCAASVYSSICFRNFYIIVFLCIGIGSSYFYFSVFQRSYILYFTLVVHSVSVIAWIISGGVSCSADSYSLTARKPDRHIWVVFIFSLLIYVGSLLIVILEISHFLALIIPFSLISLRLISDPLLCVLVCRQNLNVQTSENFEELVQSE